MSKRIRYYSEKTVKRIIGWVCPGTYFIEDIRDRIKRAKHISIPDKHGRLIDVDKLIAGFRKWADAPIKRTNNEIADFLEEYSKDSTIVEARE